MNPYLCGIDTRANIQGNKIGPVRLFIITAQKGKERVKNEEGIKRKLAEESG